MKLHPNTPIYCTENGITTAGECAERGFVETYTLYGDIDKIKVTKLDEPIKEAYQSDQEVGTRPLKKWFLAGNTQEQEEEFRNTLAEHFENGKLIFDSESEIDAEEIHKINERLQWYGFETDIEFNTGIPTINMMKSDPVCFSTKWLTPNVELLPEILMDWIMGGWFRTVMPIGNTTEYISYTGLLPEGFKGMEVLRAFHPDKLPQHSEESPFTVEVEEKDGFGIDFGVIWLPLTNNFI